jgi:DNA gyrase subunit A
VILVSEKGQALRFSVDVLRNASRTSGGVRGIKLEAGDKLAGMDIVDPKGELLVVAANGFGKRTALKHFNAHGRGTGGMKALTITSKTGPVVAVRVLHNQEELMMMSQSGVVIRTPLSSISTQGRTAQGVTLMNLKPGDRVAALALLNGGAPNGHDLDDHEPDGARPSGGASRASRGPGAASKAADSPPAQE